MAELVDPLTLPAAARRYVGRWHQYVTSFHFVFDHDAWAIVLHHSPGLERPSEGCAANVKVLHDG